MRALIVLCLFPILFVSLQATVDDPALEALLERHIEALGGRVAMQSIKTLRESGLIISADEKDKKLLLVRKRPNLIRLNIIADEIRLIVGYDGKEVWYYYDFHGERKSPEEKHEELSAIKRDSFFWPPPSEFEDTAYHFEQLEDEEINGKSQYVVKLTIEGMPGHELFYLDQNTMMISRRTVFAGDETTIITDYSAYRLVNGVRMPYRMETTSDKGKTVTITMDSIKANKGVFDSYFEKP